MGNSHKRSVNKTKQVSWENVFEYDMKKYTNERGELKWEAIGVECLPRTKYFFDEIWCKDCDDVNRLVVFYAFALKHQKVIENEYMSGLYNSIEVSHAARELYKYYKYDMLYHGDKKYS